MKLIPRINLRQTRKGLAIALVLLVCMSTAVSGAVAFSCETDGLRMERMSVKHTAGTHMADHMPISQGCSSNMLGFSCSLDNFDSVLDRQIAIADTVSPSLEFPLDLSVLKVESESAIARYSGLVLHREPPISTIPIYLKTLSFLC
jgi:hypothetical protein